MDLANTNSLFSEVYRLYTARVWQGDGRASAAMWDMVSTMQEVGFYTV